MLGNNPISTGVLAMTHYVRCDTLCREKPAPSRANPTTRGLLMKLMKSLRLEKRLVLFTSVTMLAVALACSDSGTPVAPSPAGGGTSDAAADGSTLKATVPAPQSPVNNQQPDNLVLT